MANPFNRRLGSVSLASLISTALACSSGGSTGRTTGDVDAGVGSLPGNGSTMTSGAGGGGGGIGPGLPTPGPWNGNAGVSSAVRLPGGGAATNTPLAPGCTPASATECPTISGACATGAGQTVTVHKFGTLCLYEEQETTTPASTVEYIEETVAGQSYYRFRVTFNPGFVDNTYGKNSVGWSHVRGHRYSDLVKSDHTELQLFDKNDQLTLHFKMDYITNLASRSCGYGTLGVKGGDGSMIVGDGANVLAVSTSLDRNLNSCGYCSSPACEGSCTVNSPATDKNFTPNPLTPNWDYRAQYDVWIASSAFGAAGFGKANISYVHASPSKFPEDTLTVTPKPCPPPFDMPLPPPTGGAGGTSGAGGGSGAGGTGGGTTCPVNWTEYLTSEGATACMPVPTTPPGGGPATCPAGWTVYLTSEGAVCLPTPTPNPNGGGLGCPVDWTLYVTSEGAICVPKPGSKPSSGGTGDGGGSGAGSGGSSGAGGGTGTGSGGRGGSTGSGTGGVSGGGSGGGTPVCPAHWSVYLSSEGAICLPTPVKTPTGSLGCPVDWTIYVTSEGAACVPKPGKNPSGGAPICPVDWVVYVTSEGAVCLPSPGKNPNGSPRCPVDWSLYVTSEGAVCVPESGKNPGSATKPTCPINWTEYLTSEGAVTCTPGVSRGPDGETTCPVDWTLVLTSEGGACLPIPKNGACPAGYKPDVGSEGGRCI
jgi:hypothetical protein